MTPLMCAVKVLGPKDGDDGIVAYLIENKANVNLQDIMGDTALHIACCSKVCTEGLHICNKCIHACTHLNAQP